MKIYCQELNQPEYVFLNHFDLGQVGWLWYLVSLSVKRQNGYDLMNWYLIKFPTVCKKYQIFLFSPSIPALYQHLFICWSSLLGNTCAWRPEVLHCINIWRACIISGTQEELNKYWLVMIHIAQKLKFHER